MEILYAILIVTSLGAICAIGRVVAAKYMAVKVDEKEIEVRACLPGANCGACGYTGCDGYAKALASKTETKTNLCTPGGDAVSRALSETLGVAFMDVVEEVAHIACGGDCVHTVNKAEYQGIKTCSAAKMFYGGQGSCIYGCLGFGDCAEVCQNNAICIENGIAHVDTRLCGGCGLCVKACPRNLIALIPDVERVVVTCSNPQKGAQVRKICSNGCISCTKCEKVCPHGAIHMEQGVPVIDYAKCELCYLCAKSCPTGSIMIADLSGIHRYTHDA